MIRLKLYCFGPFMALLDGCELTAFRSDKARALLAYLLLCGQQVVPRTTLQALFWEGYEPKSARANLRVTLSHLAKLLKPLKLLHITRKTVQLDRSAPELWCDVWAFEALVQEHRLDRERLQEAKRLYVGEFLADLRFKECPTFERWQKEQAKRYREQLIGLFPHNLPRQGTTFIGRQEEIDAIMKKVLDPDYPLITLMGIGGVGKSRLALSVGEQARGHFTDGVWWVPLAEIEMSERLPEELAMAIGQALNLTFTPNEPCVPSLFKHLRHFDGLLLLDNLEQLLPARQEEESATVNFILELLRQSEQLTILLTSRHRLNVLEEFVFDIEGLPVPPEKISPPLTPPNISSSKMARGGILAHRANKPSDEALTLFAERANRLGAGFELNKSNLPAVKRICQQLAGLPLGIELAAGLLASQTVAEIAEIMSQPQKRLTLSATWRSLPKRQRSLGALFEHSWRLLSASQQKTFAQLALLGGGFTTPAATEVINATPLELSALRAKSLLQQRETGRFEMHQLLHDFAAQKLALMAPGRT